MEYRTRGADDVLLDRGRNLYQQGMGRIASGRDRAAGELLLHVAADLLDDAIEHGSSQDIRTRAHLGSALTAIALHEERAVIAGHLREVARFGSPGLIPSLIVGLDSAAAAHLGAGDLPAARVAAQLCQQIRAVVPLAWLPADDEAHTPKVEALALAANTADGGAEDPASGPEENLGTEMQKHGAGVGVVTVTSNEHDAAVAATMAQLPVPGAEGRAHSSRAHAAGLEPHGRSTAAHAAVLALALSA